MATRPKKINLYLIKDGRTEHGIFIPSLGKCPYIPLKEGTLYYHPKVAKQVASLTSIFASTSKTTGQHSALYSGLQWCVLIRNMQSGTRIFAICFPHGGKMLRKNSYESHFGVSVILQILHQTDWGRYFPWWPWTSRTGLRSIPGLGPWPGSLPRPRPGLPARQLYKAWQQNGSAFGLKQMKLKLNKNLPHESRLHNIFGTTVEGSASLRVNIPCNAKDMDELVNMSYEYAQSESHKPDEGYEEYEDRDFGLQPIKEGTKLYAWLMKELDNKLAHYKEDSSDLWLFAPDSAEEAPAESHEEGKGEKEGERQKQKGKKRFYCNDNQDRIYTTYGDITFDEIKDMHSCDVLSADILKKTTIKTLHPSDKESVSEWSVYEYLYTEIRKENRLCMLIGSHWHSLDVHLADEIDIRHLVIDKYHQAHIPFDYFYKHKDRNEKRYNKRMETHLPAICMDRQMIQLKGRVKVEFCDIFDNKNNNIIHIKRHHNSSSISYLFNQGLGSTHCLAFDPEFRKKVQKRIKKVSGQIHHFSPNDRYNIVFGIIEHETNKKLPFLSLLLLTYMFDIISGFPGFQAKIQIIPHK